MLSKIDTKDLKTKPIFPNRAKATRRRKQRFGNQGGETDLDHPYCEQDVVSSAAEIMGYDLDYWKRTFVH